MAHGWSSVITITPSEKRDLIRCNICEMRISVVSIAKHAHTAYHELRKVDLEKKLYRVRMTDFYEDDRSVVSIW